MSSDKSETMKTSRLAKAMFVLGMFYATDRDFKEAAKWCRKAAELGVVDAMLILGSMYDTGEGVLEDAVEAYAWFNVAGASGDAVASVHRDQIKKRMTLEQIAEGQKRSRELMKELEAAKAEQQR